VEFVRHDRYAFRVRAIVCFSERENKNTAHIAKLISKAIVRSGKLSNVEPAQVRSPQSQNF
jgi:hypothetical protein